MGGVRVLVRKQVLKTLSSVVLVESLGSGSQAGQVLALVTTDHGDVICHQLTCQQEPSSVRERALVGIVVNRRTTTSPQLSQLLPVSSNF